MPNMVVRKPIPDYGDIESEKKIDYSREEFDKVIGILCHYMRTTTDGASAEEIFAEADGEGMNVGKASSILEDLKRDGRVYERSEGRYRLT
jgi:DNA replicative helicase MCM subunit Mcm2 (Cdc46/Mcm family)